MQTMNTQRIQREFHSPWHYQEQADAYTHIVRGSRNEHIVQLPQDTSGKSERMARFIAASPDVAAALKELVRCVRGGDKTAGVMMDDALLDADTALEKARY